MLKIKLARYGKRNQPHYRFVVTEARSKRDGKYNANLGHYAPTQHPKLLEIDVAEYEKWVAKGAQPTDTVASLFKRFQSGNPFPAKKKKPSKKSAAKAAQPAAEKKAAPAAEPAAAPKTEPQLETEAKVEDEAKVESKVEVESSTKLAESTSGVDKSTDADNSTDTNKTADATKSAETAKSADTKS